VHQHQADVERSEQIHILDELREARPLGDQLSAKADDEGAPAEGVQVGRRLS
jgi:hypothetical protein